jgi:exodeoxyribonuclease VII small subunit
MSEPQQSGSGPAAAEVELGFEAAMARLEAAVDALASGDLDLEVAMAKYEEGVRLFRLCSARLEAARLRLRQLEAAGRDRREGPLDLEDTP